MSPKTAYAKMMDDVRKEQRFKETNKGARAMANVRGVCGAKRKGGKGRCQQPRGYGTDHYGFGRCKWHGGAAPNGRKAAAKDKAILMGAPLDINPLDALIWCIKLTAGEIQFCTQQMEILEEDKWLEQTIMGKQLHLWARERQKATDRLAKFSKDALALGIADRAVRLAEQYGTSIARYTKGILEDLTPYLSPEGIKQAPLIVRKHLALLEGGGPVTAEDRRELPAIPRRVA